MKIIFRKYEWYGSFRYLVIYPECKNANDETKAVVRNFYDISGVFYMNFNELLINTVPVTPKEHDILKCNYKPELIEIIIPNERNCKVDR